MTIRDIYSYCLEQLNNYEEKYIDTELLLSFVLNKDRLYIKINLDEEITKTEEEKIKKHIEELKNDKPINYIIGVRDFYGYEFYLDENVLIPRSDTEILVEKSLNLLQGKNQSLKGLEIGVGTGIISITLLKKLSNLNMVAVDINDSAIEISKKNAENLGVSDRLNILKSDLFQNLRDMKFDFIISNPPYIDEKDMDDLPDKVKKYEPVTSLDGKKDGMYFYDSILKNAKPYLNDSFSIFFEIGYNQGELIRQCFKTNGYDKEIIIEKDYTGNDRVAVYVS